VADPFEGELGFVTGGASGSGEGVVRPVVAEGGRFVTADRQAERAEAVGGELGRRGERS